MNISIRNGNVLDELKKIPDNSVDCIVTSSPYYGLRNYGASDVVWDGNPDCEHEWNNVFCKKCNAWKGELGQEPSYKLYLQHLLQITKELKRVLKPTGTMFWNIGDSYASSGGPTRHFGYTDPKYGNNKGGFFVEPTSFDQGIIPKSQMMIPERFTIALTDEQKWIRRNFLVWYKRSGMPESMDDRFSRKWEPIFFFTKNKRYYFNLDSIRKPLSRESLKRISQKNIPNQFQSGKSMEYGKTSQNMSIPKILNNMHQKYEVKGAYTGKHSGYKNLDGTEQINENGANPGDVISAKKPYAIAERTKEYVEYRNFPDIVEFSNYINEKRKELNYTIEEIEEMMDSQAPHHWFNKESYPSVRDYERLKDLLELDGRFDENLLKVYIKSSEKQNSPNGANPGDILKEPAVRHKSWVSNAGHNFTHERKYDPDADGGDFLSIVTRAHPFAHFAVYPETLIEPLINAGCPKEVCSKCGKPKMPFREKTGRTYDSRNGEYTDEGKYISRKIAETNHVSESSVFRTDLIQETKTVMKPSCSCNANFISGTVIDPFNGSGTTMLVARNLGRSAIGIDVNPIYSEIVKKRLQWGMGLDIEHEIIEKVLS